jgi:hypothetical protein
MRTKALKSLATFSPIPLVAVLALAGPSGPALAACGGGASGGSSTGVHAPSVGTGVRAGVTAPSGSTGGFHLSSCPSSVNRTLTANVPSRAVGGVHTLTAISTVTHRTAPTKTVQANNHPQTNISHIGLTNKTVAHVRRP